MSGAPDTITSLVAANRENARALLKREIAFCQAEAARLRRECYALRLKADQCDIEADRFQRQLAAIERQETTTAEEVH